MGTATTSTRSLRALVAVVALLGGCGGDDDPPATASPTSFVDPAEEVVPGRLHECASTLPVPEGVEVLETALGRATDDSRTCVVSLRSDLGVAEVAAGLRAGFERAGWTSAVEQDDEHAALLRFTAPRCGFAVVTAEPPGSAVTVSLLDC